MTRVKICGITNIRNACAAVSAGADALGFVFAKSPRRISLKEAKNICERLAPWIATVGVFVDASLGEVLRTAQECRLSAVQLHGSESPSYARKCSRVVRVIKAFRVGNDFDLRWIKSYDTDAFLFDTKVPARRCSSGGSDKRGGTGVTFDWSILQNKKIHRPVVISGGLTPQNVKGAVNALRPYGVDVSSGVEIVPGQKSEKLMRIFIQNAKNA